MSYIAADAAFVKKQIANLIEAYPELQEDDDLLSDMLEGETDLHRVVAKAVNKKLDAKANAQAAKARKADLAERQSRFEKQDEMFTAFIAQLMEAAGIKKLVLPEATVSVTAARESVEVTDIEALPQGFFKTERKPLSKEIMTALKAGEQVPGASLVIGDSGLMVRTK